ncbi:MAG: hypothetical protein HZA90_14385 [Verrucomicrobia bacterium]|nr:hypothetical protein [Verrucomicrobiota bacterium]
MKSTTTQNSLLAAVALAGLLVYVLACSSFSPDDSQIAFPAFDAKTGDFGVTVLDRKSGRAETVFSLSIAKRLHAVAYETRLLRAQWIDDQRLAVFWPGGQHDDDALNIVAVTLGGKGPVRYWQIQDLDKMDEKLVNPLALAGSRLLVPVNSNLVARLDLDTGRVESRPCRGETMMLYPSGRSDFVFYAAQSSNKEDQVEFGKLDAATFAQTPLLKADASLFDGEGPLALSRDGSQIATAQKKGGACQIVVLQPGQTPRIVPLASGDEDLELGSLCFSPRADVVFASFASQPEGATNVSLGLMEIPLKGNPVERTVLLAGLAQSHKDSARYLQLNSSHDGKTLALCTTYLCIEPDDAKTAAANCGLFLIDLAAKPYKISKVALPVMQPGKEFK